MLDFSLQYPGKISNGHLNNDEDEAGNLFVFLLLVLDSAAM